MKLKILIFCILTVIFYSCNNKCYVSFSGKITNAENKKLYIAVVTFDGSEIIDSAKLTTNSFKFCIDKQNHKCNQLKDSPLMFKLFISSENGIYTIVNENEDIYIEADANNLIKSYSISGGTEAFLIHQLDSALLTFINSVDELYLLYENNINIDSVKDKIESSYIVLMQNHRTFLENFIEEHPNNMASYVAFFQSYNRARFFDKEKDINILRKINSNLSKKYPESEYVKSMILYTNNLEKYNKFSE